jgi:hypothetical protein
MIEMRAGRAVGGEELALSAVPETIDEVVEVSGRCVGRLHACDSALGDDEKVALAEETFGAGGGNARGDLGVFGTGDTADEANRKVRLDEAADESGGGLLSAGDEVDAGLAAALGEALNGGLQVFAAEVDKVGEFVEDDDNARVGALLAVAALHFGGEVVEGVEGVLGSRDDGEEEMRETGEREEAAALRVDEDELEVALGVKESERSDDGAGESGLAGAGRAGDEDMRDIGAGEAEEERDAFVVEAEDGGDRREGRGGRPAGSVSELDKLAAEVEEEDRLCVGARDLELELAILSEDAAGGSAEGESELLVQAFDLAELGAEGQGELEPDEPGRDGAAGDTSVDLVAGEDQLDAVRLEVEGALHERRQLGSGSEKLVIGKGDNLSGDGSAALSGVERLDLLGAGADGLAERAAGAGGGGVDGRDLDGAGGLLEGENGRVIVPDFSAAIEADDERGRGREVE